MQYSDPGSFHYKVTVCSPASGQGSSRRHHAASWRVIWRTWTVVLEPVSYWRKRSISTEVLKKYLKFLYHGARIGQKQCNMTYPTSFAPLFTEFKNAHDSECRLKLLVPQWQNKKNPSLFPLLFFHLLIIMNLSLPERRSRHVFLLWTWL